MLFNSLQFAIFFIIAYSLYLILNHKWQNRMLLMASYVFYGVWDWRFLLIIFISTVIDYICGFKIHKSKNINKRKLFLFFSIFSNLAILGYFKYFNFFATNLQELLKYFNFSIQHRFLHIILPIGISFYTFQTMSYTIDIYRKKMQPTRKFFDFALFVAFFPQLLAGPIERARHLLPQILLPRKLTLDKFYEGCYLIFWGLFQKIFVADNLARIVNPIFASSTPYNGVQVLLAIYAFTFQIFCDFAGYSNIARGLGKTMGFDIIVNFKLPYFATNPREFWQRWHISLSTWLRDYLYIPLGGSRKGELNTYRNLAITMLLGGLWHGAAWTFVIWGAYQGLLLIVHRLITPILNKIPLSNNIFMGKIWHFAKIIFFFHITCFGWLIFRARSMPQVYNMLRGLFLNFQFTPNIDLKNIGLNMTFLLCLLLIVQLIQYRENNLLAILKKNTATKITFYYIVLLLMMIFGNVGQNEFIYFQF